jgi:hypothetical protein
MYRYSLVDASGAHQGDAYRRPMHHLVTPGRPRIDSRQLKAVSASLCEGSVTRIDSTAFRLGKNQAKVCPRDLAAENRKAPFPGPFE